MAEVKVTCDRCKGCELCVLYCPKKVLQMSSNINAKGYHFPEWTDREACTGCKICATMCPEVALEVYK
ncbi:MAG TPA: 4Fe-4S binding protein [bacterium]|nr:4Fe-4S binding protein [bacterium]